MDEDTTTVAPEEQGGMAINGIPTDNDGNAIPQPEVSEETPTAVEETTEEEQQTESVEESEPEDGELAKFAEAKGLTLTSDNEKKIAKMAMNAEKLAGRQANKAGELEKTMGQMSDESASQVAQATGQDPEVLKRLQRMEVKDSIREFWDANPEARQYETEMAKIAQESGLYGSPEAILKASYAMASSSSARSEGKREALTNLAHKQQASVPKGNAVSSVPSDSAITPQNVDALVGSHDLDWFKAHQDEINTAMAG